MVKKIDGNYELQELIGFYKGAVVNPEQLYIKDMWVCWGIHPCSTII